MVLNLKLTGSGSHSWLAKTLAVSRCLRCDGKNRTAIGALPRCNDDARNPPRGVDRPGRFSGQRLIAQHGTSTPVRHVMAAQTGGCPRPDMLRGYRTAAIPTARRLRCCLVGPRRADGLEGCEGRARRCVFASIIWTQSRAHPHGWNVPFEEWSRRMTPPVRSCLLAVTLIAALGTVPALAQRDVRGGPGFHGGGFVGPHRGFVEPRPGFGRRFVEPRPGFRRGFAEPRVVVRPSFPAGFVGARAR